MTNEIQALRDMLQKQQYDLDVQQGMADERHREFNRNHPNLANSGSYQAARKKKQDALNEKKQALKTQSMIVEAIAKLQDAVYKLNERTKPTLPPFTP